ncbi:MAG: AMP nucleosidase, partial [Sphingorhabdus sp.]|nr:AMP nucleosidase [Sphingorhabdus sp.]
MRRRYESAVANLRADLIAYIKDGTAPSPSARAEGRYAYPELTIRYEGEKRDRHRTTSFGRLVSAGSYASSITRPDLFEDYLTEQLKLLDAQYEIEADIGASSQEIPYPYVLDAGSGLELGGVASLELARHFPTTDLADIGDEAADG